VPAEKILPPQSSDLITLKPINLLNLVPEAGQILINITTAV
jgi:hypothetical protein